MIIPLIHLSQRSSRYTMQRPTDGCPNGEQFGGLFRRNRHLRAHWKPIYACHAMPCTSINHPNEISLHILNQRTKHQKSICLIHPHSSTVLVVSVNGVQETKYINIPKMPFWLVVSTPLKNNYESVGMVIPNLWKNKKCSKPPASYHLLHLNNSTPGEVLLGHPVAPFRLIQTVAPQPFPPAPHSPPSSTCCGWVSCQRPLSVKEKEASWGDPVLGDWKNIYMWHGESPAGGNYICLHINKNVWSTSGWFFIALFDDLCQLWGWFVWI